MFFFVMLLLVTDVLTILLCFPGVEQKLRGDNIIMSR